jgi:DNA-binding NarL/FixJ family response regulator
MTKRDIRVLLVDDHDGFRHGLRHLLELEADMEVVGDYAKAEEAFSRMEMLSPDIVLMDIRMPGMNGIDAIRWLKEKQPACGVIMLTICEDYAAQAIEAGADGYLVKETKRLELAKAIRQVYQRKHSLRGYDSFVDELDLVIPPSVDAVQILRFADQVEKTLDARVLQTVASRGWGTAITILLKPTTLADLLRRLRNIPDVEKVADETAQQSAAIGGFLKKFRNQPWSRHSPRKSVMVTLK